MNHEVIHRNRYLAIYHWSSSSEMKALTELYARQAAEKTAWSVKCLLGEKKTQAWWCTFVMHWVNISLKLNGLAA